jgi:WD40 repeat protein
MLRLTADEDGNLKFKRKMAFKPHTGAITELSFAETSHILATAGVDGIVFFFDCRDNNGPDNSWTPLRFARMNIHAKSPDPILAEKVIVAEKMSWCPTSDVVLCSCSDGVLREVDVYNMVQVGGKRFNSSEAHSFEGSFPITEHTIKLPSELVSRGSATAGAANAAAASGNQGASQIGTTTTTATGTGTATPTTTVSNANAASATSTNTTAALDGTTDGNLNATTGATGGGVSASDASSGSLVPVRTSQAMYIPGTAELLLASTTTGNQGGGRNFFLKSYPLINPSNQDNPTLLLTPPPPSELYQGVCSSDGKEAMKTPLPTSMRCSWSNRYLAVGNSDGSVTVRLQRFPSVYSRFVGHNGQCGGVSAVALSYDDSYVLTVGKDGLLVVHRLRRDMMETKGVALAKDLESGIFGAKTTKDNLSVDVDYLVQVHSNDTLNDWSLFSLDDITAARRTSDLLEEALREKKRAEKAAKEAAAKAEEEANRRKEDELEASFPEAEDVTEGAYSIQDAKLKSEDDIKKAAAEQLKEKVRKLLVLVA